VIEMRALRILATIEASSLVILLTNVFTVHAEMITTFGGPVHGSAYLAVIVATSTVPTAVASGARWRAFVPGIGGLLALRALRNHSRERIT
jgi:hypothetical protein